MSELKIQLIIFAIVGIIMALGMMSMIIQIEDLRSRVKKLEENE